MEDGPESRRLDAVRDYVADVVGCRRDQVGTVIRFEDGNRHDVYMVSHLDAAETAAGLVVRVSLGDDRDERERAEREAMVLQSLRGDGAPQLFDVRLSSPWFETPVLSMQFVPGHSLKLASATSADIERLGSLVASVHGQSVDDLADCFADAGTILSYADGRLQHILHGLPWARAPLPVLLRDGLQRAADVIKSDWNDRRDAENFRTGEKLALLHGDIALGNVLWGPDPVLIDWEYARLGDPADEIAYLFDQNGLATAQREVFWRGYRAQVGSDASLADTMARANWWEPLTLLGSTLWWAERFIRRTEAQDAGTSDAAVPRAPDFYLERATSRFGRLEDLLDPA